MRITGTIRPAGSAWDIFIPFLGARTRGKTRRESLLMAKALVRTLVGDRKFALKARYTGDSTFSLEVEDADSIISKALLRHRQNSGLSAQSVSARLGDMSARTYYRYERGKAVPTVAILEKLLRAVGATKHLGVGV